MISKLPWRLNEDGDKIYDAEDNIIAEDYRFVHVDDFEAICRLIQSANQAMHSDEKRLCEDCGQEGNLCRCHIPQDLEQHFSRL